MVYQAIFHFAERDLRKRDFCRFGIKILDLLLSNWTPKNNSDDYAQIQHNLGTAYEVLAEVEDTKEHCEIAIRAYEEALKIRTLEKFPMGYADTQNNLGIAYRTLSEMVDKNENCMKAKTCYKNAFQVYRENELMQLCELVEENKRILYTVWNEENKEAD